MRILVVYWEGSYQKFADLYRLYLFEIDEKNILKVYKIDQVTHEEHLIAAFRTWNYFLIEED